MTHITFGIKGNDINGIPTAIMVLKASLQESTHNKYAGYILLKLLVTLNFIMYQIF